jgi:predicted nucleic acid-binding protein
MSGLTLDAGALIALDRGDRRLQVLIALSQDRGDVLTVPATALAQAIRSPARQALLARMLRQPNTAVVQLDGKEATEVGLVLAESGTSDIVDAHVVICARRGGQTIATSDASDLRRLDRDIDLYEV